jgi:plasmid stabilization system protein ParE
MALRVEVSAQAERDAEEILDWLLTHHSGRPGIDWFLALDDAFASLAEFPERCPLAPENTRFPFEVRQLLRTEASYLSHTPYH